MRSLPPAVLAAVGGSELVDIMVEPLTGGTGAATATVDRLTLRIRDGSGALSSRHLVRKALRPLTEGRHAVASRAVDHWAYWRREALAYASGLLPTGPGLAAPRLFAVDGDVLYIEEVRGEPEWPAVAARRLGEWIARTPVPDEPWLTQHQLAQRVAVSELDWNAVDGDVRLAALWSRREELLAEATALTFTVVHGDYSAGNIRRTGDATTVAIDWATFGTGPVGADLASLTLTTGAWLLEDFLAGLDGAVPVEEVRRGYEIALALVHASRVHWALGRGLPVDSSLTEMLLGRIRA